MQTTFYTIYKTTNLVNGKIYIGKHKTTDPNDDYLGSGKHLVRAIEKYGRENFSKEILFVFDNEAEMNTKERELVTKEFVLQETNYNLCVGGHGGFSYINRFNLGGNYKNKKDMDLNKLKLARAQLALLRKDEKWVSDQRKRISEGSKNYFKTNPGNFFGRQHSIATKEKMSESLKGCGKGNANSQFGTCWITDGNKNKKIKKSDPLPVNWQYGRTIK